MPQVPTQIRRERARKLREIGKKIYCKLLKNQILHKHRVLIESDKGIGKTENNFKNKPKIRRAIGPTACQILFGLFLTRVL